MLKPGERLFAQLPGGGNGPLHPATVEESGDAGYRVVFEDPLDLSPGQELLLYFDDMRMFVQQPARVRALRALPRGTLVQLGLTGERVSAERRSVARVSAQGSNLLASIDGSEVCEVLEISSLGLTLAGAADVHDGDEAGAILHHGSDDLGGSVDVKSVREIGGGKRRFGVVARDGLLKFALTSVNLAVQREQLRRLSQEAASAPGWSKADPARLDPRVPAPVPASGPEVRRVVLPFRSLLAFEREFQTNIARGGIFVPTTEPFERGARVEVELDLRFCAHRVVLAAEVVSFHPPDLAAAGGSVGVAVQFLESVTTLRSLLTEVAGVEAAAAITSLPQRDGGSPRHRRTRTRIAAVLGVRGRSRPAHTRNVSRSGALIVAEGDPPPIGERLQLTLVDPRRGESVRIDALVVRRVERDGRVIGVGVRFEIDPDAQSAVTTFLDGVQAASHTRALGHIDGTLSTLGLPNLLQMLAVCVDEGTLVLHRDDEEAQILFERGTLRSCSVGPIQGLKALARILEWEEADFEFQPLLPLEEPAGVAVPIENALLECTHQVDELNRVECYPLPPDAMLVLRGDAVQGATPAELEVLARIGKGCNARQILDALPTYDSEIYGAIDALLRRGALAVRA
jgi:Tfp pilus assembly protein PilZ